MGDYNGSSQVKSYPLNFLSIFLTSALSLDLEKKKQLDVLHNIMDCFQHDVYLIK